MSTDSAPAPVKVSVALVTYNHRPYLERAVESVLAQRTPFPCEIVLAEDASTDGTRELAVALARAHPDRIRLSLSAANGGECATLARALDESRGDYVALLDGDDFFTSPHKLAVQAAFLDAHPGAALCFHDATIVTAAGEATPARFTAPAQAATLGADDLWDGNVIATCTAMLRRSAIAGRPSWFGTMPWGDWPLYVLAARHGTVEYLDRVMAAYRVHAGGAWSGQSEIGQLIDVLAFYAGIAPHVDARARARIAQAVERHAAALAAAVGPAPGDAAQAAHAAIVRARQAAAPAGH